MNKSEKTLWFVGMVAIAAMIALTGCGNTILYGVGWYDGTDNSWETYGGSAAANPVSEADDFAVGKGYQMATQIPLNGFGAAIEFDGNLYSGDMYNIVPFAFTVYV